MLLIMSSLNIFIILWSRGKQADASPDCKRLSAPMDTHNTRGITCAMPAFGEWGGGRVWAYGIPT